MTRAKDRRSNQLVERVVRNEDIFCSILLDQWNRTLRVVDFRGGNFQAKHNYLERVLMSEGMRKIFTLIERDDMSGWQRIGYQREGAIPGYYKRSDAYVMSRLYDADFQTEAPTNEESQEQKDFFQKVKVLAKKISEQKAPTIRADMITENEASEAIRAEVARAGGAKTTAKTKKPKKMKMSTTLEANPPVFPQFSRAVEHFHMIAQNRRTKQANVFGAEYQDCFGNAKIDICFSPTTRVDQNLAFKGLTTFIDQLTEQGAVSLFALAQADDVPCNALFAAAGFRNTGWLHGQILSGSGLVDQLLWTRKLT